MSEPHHDEEKKIPKVSNPNHVSINNNSKMIG